MWLPGRLLNSLNSAAMPLFSSWASISSPSIGTMAPVAALRLNAMLPPVVTTMTFFTGAYRFRATHAMRCVRSPIGCVVKQSYTASIINPAPVINAATVSGG